MKNGSSTRFQRSFAFMAWCVFRSALLNVIILGAALLLAWAREWLEGFPAGALRFPLMMYATSAFLSNMAYFSGVLFEWFHMRLWRLDTGMRANEAKLFKLALVLMVIVNSTISLAYFLQRVH